MFLYKVTFIIAHAEALLIPNKRKVTFFFKMALHNILLE